MCGDNDGKGKSEVEKHVYMTCERVMPNKGNQGLHMSDI